MKLETLILRFFAVSLCVGMSFRPGGVRAQEADPGAFRDSLARVTDTLALRRLDEERAHAGSSAAVFLQRGLIHLRLREITHRDRHASHAEQFFAEAERAGAPKSWTAYGKGLSLTAAHDVRIPSPGGVLNGIVVAQTFAEILGLDPATRARRAFRKSLESDSLFTPAAIELGELAARTHKEDVQRDAIVPLERALARDSSNAGAALALADVALSAGELVLAEQAAARALSSGRDSAIALRAWVEAVAAQKGREQEAERAYLRGVALADSAALRMYYADVELIASEAEQLEWAQATGEEQRRDEL